MVGQITSAISSYDLNIADMVNRSRGDYAYTMIDIDNEVNSDILPSLEKQKSNKLQVSLQLALFK
ncbi:hypothetical protein GCM10020331_074460 [Ectobacillus funiculus]